MASIQDNQLSNQMHPMEGLPPVNSLRLRRMNGHYIDPYHDSYQHEVVDVLERSLSSSSSPTFVWPTGTVTFTPFGQYSK